MYLEMEVSWIVILLQLIMLKSQKQLAASTNSPRFGIIASKKVGNAVQRNFAKRIIKALKNIFLNFGKNEFDYILVAKKNLLNENFKILSSQLEQTLNKISWMNKKIYY